MIRSCNSIFSGSLLPFSIARAAVPTGRMLSRKLSMNPSQSAVVLRQFKVMEEAWEKTPSGHRLLNDHFSMSHSENQLDLKGFAVGFGIHGTLTNFGSTVQVNAVSHFFQKHFNKKLTNEQIREKMGCGKKEYFADLWWKALGTKLTLWEAERCYPKFEEVLMEHIEADGSEILPDVFEIFKKIKDAEGLTFTTTGYAKQLAAPILSNFQKQGLKFDVEVTGDMVSAGRGHPYGDMIRKAGALLKIKPERIIHIDDTLIGGMAHVDAMCTGVIVLTGDTLEISKEELCQLSPSALEERVFKAEKKARAHSKFVIPRLNMLDQVFWNVINLSRLMSALGRD